jgi:hypothetical protein
MSDKNSAAVKAAAQSPAAFRCLISSVATVAQLLIFTYLRLLDWPPGNYLALWCWVVALEIGITFGVLGFCSSRIWWERILAVTLLCYQFASLWILFNIGVASYMGIH